MSAPVPSPSQIEAINGAKTIALAGVQGAIDSVAALEAAIIKYQDIDNYAKSLFDYYGANIIDLYENEIRWMNGLNIVQKIVEQDILDFINNTGRLENGTLEPERISEFDGTPLVIINNEYETNLISDQDIDLDRLQNGLTGFVILDPSAITTTVVDVNTTSIGFSSTATETVSAGDRLLIQAGSDSCVVEVVSVSGACTGEDNPPQNDQASCELDNGTWEPSLAVIVLIPPVSALAIGSVVGQNSFDGFNNTERTNKVPINLWENGLMTNLIDSLQDAMERRILVLDSEILEATNNQDDNFDLAAITKMNTSKTDIAAFLGLTPPTTLLIDDTSITLYNNESTLRSGEISSRISAIATAISTGNFYNQRYNQATSRGQKANGHLAQLKGLEDAKANAQSGQGSAAALAVRYDSMIP